MGSVVSKRVRHLIKATTDRILIILYDQVQGVRRNKPLHYQP